MMDHNNGPPMEAWLRSQTGIDDWTVRTTANEIYAWSGAVSLSRQPSTWDACRAWKTELSKRGLLDRRPE